MRTVTPPGAAADATAARELARYEELRAGRRAAFVALATELDPVLGDLAQVSTGSPAAARRLVRHTWAVTLPGLDLFAWRCSLRAWVAGLLVGLAHPDAMTVAGSGSATARGGWGALASATPGGARPGPADWSDLPWGPRWGDAAWDALERARAGLPVVQRQAVVLADVHGCGQRDAADTLGLTAQRYTRVIGTARVALHDVLARLGAAPPAGCWHDRVALLGSLECGTAGEGLEVATCAGCATLARRWQAAAALLAAAAARPPAALDPELLALFRRWRTARRRGLARWLSDLGWPSVRVAATRRP